MLAAFDVNKWDWANGRTYGLDGESSGMCKVVTWTKSDRTGMFTVCVLTVLVWSLNSIWLLRDTRPPVWDMALHQTYALNYFPGSTAPPGQMMRPWERSGSYPPFVHLVIAFVYFVFHPGPHVSVLANIPATFLLLWASYQLGVDHAGQAAGQWACILAALTPYLVWMSRETILDYWLSAWVAVALVVLLRTRGFESRGASLLLGCIIGVGMLTKWLFLGFILGPLVYVSVRHRVWDQPVRSLHLAETLITGGVVAGVWYLPNLPHLARYFFQNAEIGALEGEPPVLSFQSAIYYVRLLEGYQLFAVLFSILCLAVFFVWKNKLLRDGLFLGSLVAGGWIIMTLLRTKDPRFTMPLLGPLAVVSGSWIASWKANWVNRTGQTALVALLGFQLYAANFGIPWLPRRWVLMEGYQGSLRWDWNFYLQDYFEILGRPKRENWRQDEILGVLTEHSSKKKLPVALAVVPDLPRFNTSNFQLYARLRGMPLWVGHPKSAEDGVHSFDGFNYVLMTEKDQGMPWTTGENLALNRKILDEHEIFRLIRLFQLPGGNCARLYFIQRGGPLS